MGDFLVGDHVDVNGQHAVVRFVGQTKFSPGDWIGVELDTPSGKNNGVVQGEQYFVCRDKYGMFVRPQIPRLMERPPPPRQPPPQQQKRISVASPPPGGAPSPVPGAGAAAKGRPMSLRSPTKPASPTKGFAPTPGSSGTSTPRTNTPNVGTRAPSMGAKPRPGSMGPPAAPASASRTVSTVKRSSTGATMSRTNSLSGGAPTTATRPGLAGARAPGRPAAGSLSVPARKASAASNASDRSSPEGPLRRARTDTVAGPTSAPRMRRESSGGSAGGGAKPPPGGAAGNSAALAAAQREAEDLKSKIKVLEKKRLEDRDKISTLQRVQEERDKYESIIQKLQAKYQPQQQEITELRKKMKDMELAMEEMEDIKAEHDMIVEMATLDREMAEEQTEAYKAELEAVRGKAEELEMEVEILREENNELAQGMSPEERSSAGWLQLEKQNGRLKEALIRLREITESAEAELKDNIKSLEEDVTDLSKYKANYEEMREKLVASEAAVDDLRQQLEAALGAEEMLEELTDRNMDLNEQIDELRATVEDLESLKEISDELEINHIESEKQMQEDLDFKDQIIREQAVRISQLDASNEEAEYTITKFRDVVGSLQNDLEDMKASQQITETEAEELTARSRSMMDINMKLQITAAKAQNKTIDLELRRMEAEEAIEHLAIVQMFLPESFHTDRDSVLALLRFKRVTFKAHLLQTFVKERISAQSTQLQPGAEDTVTAACDMVDKLTWVSAMCDRFTACITSCPPAQFHKFQGALYELDPVERALNGWIEGLRRDDLKEKVCAAELQRTMALMSHLAEIHLRSDADLDGFAGELHMRVVLMQSHMESAAAAMAHVRLLVQSRLPALPEDEETSEIATGFAKRTDAVISHSRSAKVVIAKILRALEEFRARSLSLTRDKLAGFEEAEELTKKMTDYARAAGDAVYELLYSDAHEGADSAFSPGWETVQNTLLGLTEKTWNMAESEVWGSFTNELRSLTALLADLGATASDIDMTAEFDKAPPPWIVRAKELKATKVVNIDIEEELVRLKEQLHERATTIKLRELALEEAAVKIELLESRMRNVTKQTTRIEELEAAVGEGAARERDFIKTIEDLNEELQTLELDVTKLKKAAEDKRALGDSAATSTLAGAESRAVATQKEVLALQKEIAALRGAVAWFREEAARVRGEDAAAPDSWLLRPLVDPARRSLRAFEDDLAREAREVETELIKLATETGVVPLRDGDRRRWRPRQEHVAVRVAEAREAYEEVRAWGNDVVERAELHGGFRRAVRPRTKGRGEKAAWVRVQGALPGRLGVPKVKGAVEGLEVGEVRIRDPEGWEAFEKVVGIAED